jgi:hypothetical protein
MQDVFAIVAEGRGAEHLKADPSAWRDDGGFLRKQYGFDGGESCQGSVKVSKNFSEAAGLTAPRGR